MAQEAGHHSLLGDGSHEAQCATAAQRTGRHIQGEGGAEQPGPVPIRGSPSAYPRRPYPAGAGGMCRRPEPAGRRQTAAVADQMGARQGHERRKFAAWESAGAARRSGIVGENLSLKIDSTHEIGAEDPKNDSNISNMAGEAYMENGSHMQIIVGKTNH